MASDPISVDLSGIINLPAASEDTDGLVELANVEETQEGVDETLAVTPAAAAATYVAIDDFTEKGDLLVATGEGSYVALHVESNGTVLTACSTAPTGLCWVAPTPPAPPAIPCSVITGKGVVLTGTSNGTPVALSAGNNDQVLVACNSSSTGLAWTDLPEVIPSIPCSVVTGKGVVLTGISSGNPAALPVGNDCQVLIACSSSSTGLAWVNLPQTTASIPCSAISGRGAILTGTSAGIPAALPLGVNGQVLTVSTSTSTGLSWQPLPNPEPAIPAACLTGKGALVSATGANAPVALPVGTSGQILTVCPQAPSGLAWRTMCLDGIPTSTITGKGALLTGSAANTPVALPVGDTGQVLRANSTTATGLEWSNVGKTVTKIFNSGGIALSMDNLRICFNASGNRTWSFGLNSGTDTAFYQTTCSSGTILGTQNGSVTLSCSTFREMGWNFTTAAGCATYMICLGPASAPTAIYCFVGMVGQNYNGNFFALTRLF